MSGGHFDYAQYRINDIIESIEQEIEEAAKERPPLVTSTEDFPIAKEMIEVNGKRVAQYWLQRAK